jgi:hypothetical protein
MFNKYWIETSETEFQKDIPMLNSVYAVKDKNLLFYSKGTGENLAVLKLAKDEQELHILFDKKTGWRPNAKRLRDYMKKCTEVLGEIHILVDTVTYDVLFNFTTGEVLANLSLRPYEACTKKEVKCLAFQLDIDTEGKKLYKPYILKSYTDNVAQVVYFKNCSNLLLYSNYEPDIFGSKIVYRAIMEYNAFDPESALSERLETIVNPCKSTALVQEYNYSELVNMFRINKMEVKPSKEVIDDKQLALHLPNKEFLTMNLSELMNKLKAGRVLESTGANKVFILCDSPEVEKEFPYEISEFYQFFNSITIQVDKNKPKDSWKNKTFMLYDTRKEFEKVLGFTSTNNYQLDIKAPNNIGIIHIQ